MFCRSIESSRQQLHAGRSAEAQMLDSVLSTQPFPGSCTSQSTNQAQPGHQAGAFQGCRPMHSSHHAFHQNFSNDSAASQQSLQDMPASQRQSHLQAGHYAPSQMLIPAPDGTVLAHAAPTGVSPAFLEVPDSLDAIVNGLEGGQLSLLPEATATGDFGLEIEILRIVQHAVAAYLRRCVFWPIHIAFSGGNSVLLRACNCQIQEKASDQAACVLPMRMTRQALCKGFVQCLQGKHKRKAAAFQTPLYQAVWMHAEQTLMPNQCCCCGISPSKC